MVEKELLDLLICPNCKGAVQYRQEEQAIVCVGECHFEYPVVNSIPHMLVEEARKPSL